ncbi:MAG TPA: hypothetical protein VI688_06150 [Anaerolineales bacterium]|nr:hypothetical protein [Anaerolineales bacterium]HLE73806.1 hypothetical protein [Anaerolineales bacterium]
MLVRKIVAGMLGAGGFVFFLQGAGLFTQYPSLMNNEPIWAVIGIGLVIAGLIVWPRKTL